MRFDLYSMRWIIALVAMLATAIFSAGCGGGGGGGGSNGGGASYSYSGTVVSSTNGAALPDYTVTFNGNSAYESTTNSSGKFDITGVPTSAVTGADTLIVSSSSQEEATYTIPAGSKGVSNVTIQVGPPPPPGV